MSIMYDLCIHFPLLPVCRAKIGLLCPVVCNELSTSPVCQAPVFGMARG